MATLVNQLKTLNRFADLHLQIKSYGQGDIYDFATSGTTQYFSLWADPLDTTVGTNGTINTIRVYCADRISKDKSNYTEVLSNTKDILLDCVAYMMNPSYDWIVDKNLTLVKFGDPFHNDEIAGHYVDLPLRQHFAADRCQIPLSAEQPTSTSVGLNVLIYNEAGTLIATVAAPGSYTVEGGGSATVRNSDSSYSTTVDAGDTLVLPNETINVYVNGVLNQTGTYIPLDGTEINITV